MMRLLQFALVFGLTKVILCDGYDELIKDVCLRKAYVCGDHRVSITGGTGSLVTEPLRFGEICREHKEFIACIEDASDFCVGKMTNLSRMVLDNRKSVKMFCTDLEWRKNYFASAKCINENEHKVMDDCRQEESEFVDDRPWWCLIPEPCEALQRVFDCSVRKMANLCGTVAAEVYRRIQILKVENRDVVCEYRRLNPYYCRYQRRDQVQRHRRDIASDLKEKTDLFRQIGDLPPSVTDLLNDAVRTVIINTISKLEEHKGALSDTLEIDALKLRKLLAVNNTASVEKESKYFDKSTFQEGLNLYLDVVEIKQLQDFIKHEKLQLMKKDFQQRIKDYVVRLLNLIGKENIEVGSFGEDFIETYWKELESLPIRSIACEWENIMTRKMFKCTLKLDQKKPEEFSSETKEKVQFVNEGSITYSKLLSSLMDRIKDVTVSPFAVNDETKVTEAINNPLTSEINLGLLDIHRTGYLDESPDDLERNPFVLASEDSEVNADRSVNLEDLYSTPQTGYILVDRSYYPTVTGAYLVDIDPTTESYIQSKSEESKLAKEQGISRRVEETSESIQLREIEDAIEERFKDMDTDVPKSQIESGGKDHCSADQLDNECGSKGSTFTEHVDILAEEYESSTRDTQTSAPDENTKITLDGFYEAIDQLVKGTYKNLVTEVTTVSSIEDSDSFSTPSCKRGDDGADVHLSGSLRKFKKTTTEDPFHASIQQLEMEDSERLRYEEELASFIKEKNEMIERDRKAFSKGFAGSKSDSQMFKEEL